MTLGPSAPPDAGAPLIALPGTGWRVWRDAILRTTGFPVDGLDRFAAPDAARAADALLAAADPAAGTVAAQRFDAALAASVAACSREAYRTAGEPRLAAAVAWQNRNAVHALRGLRATGPDGVRNSKRRQREILVLRYWQRYCAKNDSIGFFGPVCWVDLTPGSSRITAEPGPELTRSRLVMLEHWALEAVQRRLAADPAVRAQLPPARQADVLLRGRRAHRPEREPVTLSAAEAAVLGACDGRRSAARLAADLLAADPGAAPVPGRRTGLADPADVLLHLDRLVARGLVDWPAPLPIRLTAESILHERVAAMTDPAARATAHAALARLSDARDRVGAAGTDDPDEVLAALLALDAEFEAISGHAAQRRGGQVYAGRTVCVQDTTRDLTVRVGDAVLAAVGRPLDVLLRAARWLSAAMAAAFTATMRGYHGATADEDGRAALDDLWYLGRAALFGDGERPLDAVGAEFVRRMSALLGLDAGTDRSRVALDADALAAACAEHFPDTAPGWRAARLHSPDLHLCPTPDYLARYPTPSAPFDADDFFVVLGELHAAMPAFDTSFFVHCHPRPDLLEAALTRDLGVAQLRPLLPVGAYRHTPRTTGCLDAGVQYVATEPAPAGAAGALPAGALWVTDDGDTLWVEAPDGRRWPLVELFVDLLTAFTADAFKVLSVAPHTPRVSVGRLVVARETWRTTVADTGLATAAGERDRYLAGRRLRRALGLPDRVFVGVAGEPKPVYVDLTSPLHLESLAGLCRAAGADATVTLSELLPGPEHAWVPDAAGHRYHSELRLQIRDERTARSGGES